MDESQLVSARSCAAPHISVFQADPSPNAAICLPREVPSCHLGCPLSACDTEAVFSCFLRFLASWGGEGEESERRENERERRAQEQAIDNRPSCSAAALCTRDTSFPMPLNIVLVPRTRWSNHVCRSSVECCFLTSASSAKTRPCRWSGPAGTPRSQTSRMRLGRECCPRGPPR